MRSLSEYGKRRLDGNLRNREYNEKDASACGDCFYEGYFSCSVDQNVKYFCVITLRS